MRAIAFTGVILALAANTASSQTANVAGQPVLRAPPQAPAQPSGLAKQSATTAAKPSHAPVAKAPSTPESRSAAALALSADPVFDEDTYQRLKEALLSYADIQVRGGWPTIPADAKLAPGASGPEVALLRRRLVIGDDLAPEQEAGDSYDAAVAEAVKRFQVRHDSMRPAASTRRRCAP